MSFISLDQDGDAGVGYYCTQYQTQQLKAGDDVYPTGGTATDDGRTSMVSQIDNGTNGGVEEVIEVRR